MLKAFLYLTFTLFVMVISFLGLRGFFEDTWPGPAQGVLEIVAYCFSVLWGISLHERFTKWRTKKDEPDQITNGA